jgi:hypothetical protein
MRGGSELVNRAKSDCRLLVTRSKKSFVSCFLFCLDAMSKHSIELSHD